MRVLRIILAACVVFVLQLVLSNIISLGEASPDFVLILLIVLAMRQTPAIAVVTGFLLGFLQDLGNASYLGMNALAKSLTRYVVARYASDLLPDSSLFKGLLIFVSALAGDVILLNIMLSFDQRCVLAALFRYSLLAALYTAVLGVVVFKVIDILPGRTVRSGGGF